MATLEVTELEARALRAAIQWAQANIELYEYQIEAFKSLQPKLENI
jgi:hypothetical protein